MSDGRVAAGATAMVVLLVGIMLINPLPIGVVHDDAMYVILGKSLASGQGLHWINLPGAPAATHYPPGFPALLSLVWRVMPDFPANVVAFKALNAVLLAVAAGAIVVFAQKRLGWSARAAAAVALAGCLSVPMLVLSTTVMSETFFLALLVPALIYADHVVEADDTPSRAALLGAIGGALMLVRTHAIAFVVAAVVALLIARRVRAAVICAVSAFAVTLPWELWVSAHRGSVPEAMRGDYESYGNWLVSGANGNAIGLAFRTLAGTTRQLFGMLVSVTTAGLPTIALRLFGVVAAIALLVLGLIRLSRRARVAALFVGAYLAIVVLWPFNPTRFVWGVWPLIVVAFAAGAAYLRDWTPSRRAPLVARYVAIAGAVAVVAGYAVYNVRGYRGQWWSSIGRQQAAVAVPSVLWVGDHTQPGDVVASNAELMIYLYTGRQAVPATRLLVSDYFALPTAESRADALESILRAYRANVVAIVANDSLEAAARRMASRQPPALALRDSVPHGLILSSMVR